MTSKVGRGVASTGAEHRPIRGQFIGPVLRFPGPPVIHNMLMTLTLLITAQRPNLKPCGGRQQRPRPPQHSVWQHESTDSRMIDGVLLFAHNKPTHRGCETVDSAAPVGDNNNNNNDVRIHKCENL